MLPKPCTSVCPKVIIPNCQAMVSLRQHVLFKFKCRVKIVSCLTLLPLLNKATTDPNIHLLTLPCRRTQAAPLRLLI